MNCLDVKCFVKKDEIDKLIDLTNYATIDEISKGFVKQDGICQNSCDNGFVADDSANCVGML